MPDRKSEPDVNRLKGNPNSQRADFYVNAPDQSEKADEDDEEPTQKVTSLPSGAKRDSYFKKRDY